MSISSIAQYACFLAVVTALVKPVGTYLARVFNGGQTWLDRFLHPVERLIYRVMRIDPAIEMSWKNYAIAFIFFSGVGTLMLYAILRLQMYLPGNPTADQLTTPMTPDLASNTAVSFSTTTTWQAYGGENTMKYWTQLVGLAAQNFLAGAAGLAVGIAFIRGFARELSGTVGNFWFDLVRSILWVLLPICLVGSILMVSQGVPMTFAGYAKVTTLQGDVQIIARGPVAALEFIKNLGTNGGGFFNVNGAHPFEGPTPFANLLSMLAIAVLPAALTYTFGHMVGRPKVGWILYIAMVVQIPKCRKLIPGGSFSHRYKSDAHRLNANNIIAIYVCIGLSSVAKLYLNLILPSCRGGVDLHNSFELIQPGDFRWRMLFALKKIRWGK